MGELKMGMKLRPKEKFEAGNKTQYNSDAGIYAQIKSITVTKNCPIVITIDIFVSKIAAENNAPAIDKFRVVCPVNQIDTFFQAPKSVFEEGLKTSPENIKIHDVFFSFAYEFISAKDENGDLIHPQIVSGSGAIFKIEDWEKD
jgi:hypothetical protein